MRPTYETDLDRSNEESVIGVIAKLSMCDHMKLPKAYRADYVLIKNGRPVCIVEIKCRNVSIDKYETIMISAHKRMECVMLANELRCEVRLVIRYTDGIYAIDFKQEPDWSSVGGRWDRNDQQDVEIVHHYKTARLKKI